MEKYSPKSYLYKREKTHGASLNLRKKTHGPSLNLRLAIIQLWVIHLLHSQRREESEWGSC